MFENVEMRLLSFWQPWLWLMEEGLKEKETRPQRTKFRGWTALHATQRKITRADLETLAVAGRGTRLLEEKIPGRIWRREIPIVYGAITSVARIQDCREMVQTEEVYGWKRLDSGVICPTPRAKTKDELFEATGFGAVEVDEPIKGLLAVPVNKAGQEVIAIDQQTPLEIAVGLWQPGRFAITFDKIHKLPEPIPYLGVQGTLQKLVDPQTIHRISKQLPELNLLELSHSHG